MLELNKIYNMDCIEWMKLIPDWSIDCIITDPPYWTTVLQTRYYNSFWSYARTTKKNYKT